MPTCQRAAGFVNEHQAGFAHGACLPGCAPRCAFTGASPDARARHGAVDASPSAPAVGRVGAVCRHLSVRGSVGVSCAKFLSLLCQKGLQIRGSHQFFSPCKSPQCSHAIALSVTREGGPAAGPLWTTGQVLPKHTPERAAICLPTSTQLATFLPFLALRLHP